MYVSAYNRETSAPFLRYALSLFNGDSADSAACRSAKMTVLQEILDLRHGIAAAARATVDTRQHVVAKHAVQAAIEASTTSMSSAVDETYADTLEDYMIEDYIINAMLATAASTDTSAFTDSTALDSAIGTTADATVGSKRAAESDIDDAAAVSKRTKTSHSAAATAVTAVTAAAGGDSSGNSSN
jgi:hypothetical protein